MSKLSKPYRTFVVDLSGCEDKIDFESTNKENITISWAKLEEVGYCAYRVFNSFNSKMPNGYLISRQPLHKEIDDGKRNYSTR